MKNKSIFLLGFALYFLFFIQLAGLLVESIYIIDLMNTSLDAKALGLLFFFSPALLLPFRRKIPDRTAELVAGLLILARGLAPYLGTSNRMLASGLGIGAALLLFPFLTTARPKGGEKPAGSWVSAGLALGVGLSTLLRTVNHSLDLSLTVSGGWIGWGLGLLFGWTLTQIDWQRAPQTLHSNGRVVSAAIGIFLALTLTYFAFAAPAVIVRWTQGNYPLIVSCVSLLALGWVAVTWSRPAWLERISRRALLIWNLLFTLGLTATLLVHRISFPATPESPAVVVGAPAWYQHIPLALMLLTFPVIFLDLRLFFCTLEQEAPSPSAIVPGMLAGSLALVLLVFIVIFTNVWGYVEPISAVFRNQFYLPYLLLAGGLTLLSGGQKPFEAEQVAGPRRGAGWGWGIALAAILLVTAASAIRAERVQPGDANKTSLTVMTYNIQGANDGFAERSYERQLALIRQVSPDILALQESDTARISFNNNDYVRYYAAKLGYYSYYGPTTVTGTFGTAILSRYPLQNPRAVFTYSDTDEIGTAEAEITVAGRTFTIYNVHPDGSEAAMLTFARNLQARSADKANVIALGDYNLRDTEEAFHLISAVYTNAWTSVHPSKIGADGTDMSGDNRIDHIFLSPHLFAANPMYILPPTSATDHPVHWTEVHWKP